MDYRHTKIYGGHVPAGPEPEFVETEYGTAIVYANEYGNIVAQTADPENPFIKSECKFDVGTELCWDGSGTRGAVNDVLFAPGHMRSATIAAHMGEVHKALSLLIPPYAEKNAAEIAKLAVADAEHRLQEIDKERRHLRRRIDDAPEAPVFKPVTRQLPIGPVYVSLTRDGFKVEGAGFGGTVDIDGHKAEYKATLPIGSTRPWCEIRYLHSNSNAFELWHDRTNEAMLLTLRDGLQADFAAEIERLKAGAQVERDRKQLAHLNEVHASLSSRKAFQEELILEMGNEATAAPVA